MNFNIFTLKKYITTNFEINFWGYSHFGLSKGGVLKNEHSSSACDTTFLLQNTFLVFEK